MEFDSGFYFFIERWTANDFARLKRRFFYNLTVCIGHSVPSIAGNAGKFLALLTRPYQF